MEKEVGTVLIDLIQGATDIPGHPVDVIVEQDIKILPDVIDLSKGFMPERLQQDLGLRSILTVAKQVGAGLRFDRFVSTAGIKSVKNVIFCFM